MSVVVLQSKGREPVRIVNVASKMHELAGGVDVDDPHFQAKGAFSSLAAYNRSKLCQARAGLTLQQGLASACRFHQAQQLRQQGGVGGTRPKL